MPHPKLTWEDIVQTHQEVSGLAPIETEKAALALAHLRSVFGEDVMALSELLLRFLVNRAPWTYRSVVWLSDSLNRLAPAVGYAEVPKRLRQSTEFVEALSVIEVAVRSRKNHPSAVGFDPFVEARRKMCRRRLQARRPATQAMDTKRYRELIDKAVSSKFHEDASRKIALQHLVVPTTPPEPAAMLAFGPFDAHAGVGHRIANCGVYFFDHLRCGGMSRRGIGVAVATGLACILNPLESSPSPKAADKGENNGCCDQIS